MAGPAVIVDASNLVRGVERLALGLTRDGTAGAVAQAQRTAGAIRDETPVLTGALASTIGVVRDGTGAGVTYGGGPAEHYAWKIERTSRAVADALDSAPEAFESAMTAVAAAEVRRL